jgi:hypothetical protein
MKKFVSKTKTFSLKKSKTFAEVKYKVYKDEDGMPHYTSKEVPEGNKIIKTVNTVEEANEIKRGGKEAVEKIEKANDPEDKLIKEEVKKDDNLEKPKESKDLKSKVADKVKNWTEKDGHTSR